MKDCEVESVFDRGVLVTVYSAIEVMVVELTMGNNVTMHLCAVPNYISVNFVSLNCI